MDQLQQLMQVYDLAALRDYWNYLERLFSRLEETVIQTHHQQAENQPVPLLSRVYTIQVFLVQGSLGGENPLIQEIDFL